MQHDQCTCGTLELCECTCKECLFRNSERIAAEERLDRLSKLLHRLESAGIRAEDLGELVWMARGPFIEQQIAKRVEQAVKETFSRLKIQVDWRE